MPLTIGRKRHEELGTCEKNDVPSKIVLRHGDDALSGHVHLMLNRRAARVRQTRNPLLNQTVLEQTGVALNSVKTDSVQLTCRRIGDWEGELEAVDETGSLATLRFRYNGAGTLGGFGCTGDGSARKYVGDVLDLLCPPTGRTGTDG